MSEIKLAGPPAKIKLQGANGGESTEGPGGESTEGPAPAPAESTCPDCGIKSVPTYWRTFGHVLRCPTCDLRAWQENQNELALSQLTRIGHGLTGVQIALERLEEHLTEREHVAIRLDAERTLPPEHSHRCRNCGHTAYCTKVCDTVDHGTIGANVDTCDRCRDQSWSFRMWLNGWRTFGRELRGAFVQAAEMRVVNYAIDHLGDLERWVREVQTRKESSHE